MNRQDPNRTAKIERVGYDPGTGALTVWFRGSRRYDFADVPPELYEQLCGADDDSQDHHRCDRLGDPDFPKLGQHRH